jgi:hypothetical protein
MTVVEWFRTVAYALNDDEPTRPFQRYPLEKMLFAYHQAMSLVAQYRPDLFTELKVVQLHAGKYQDVRGCCTKVLDVLDQVDARGNVIRELKNTRSKTTVAERNWKKASCLPVDANAYVIQSVNIDKNLDGRFTVHPPVPCGIEAYAMVKCVGQPCPLSEADANAEMPGTEVLNAAAWHYVLAMQLTGDRFANGSANDKSYHYRMFFDMLGIQQRQDERIEAKEEA